MATDVILDQENGTAVHLVAHAVKAVGSDFLLDAPDRRKDATPFRRALVHNQGDGLTINFAGDYPGGVAINGSMIVLDTLRADSLAAGDIQFTFQRPDELDQDGNPRIEGVPETVLLGALLTELRKQISSLMDRVAQLERK
jgi:hypothetical protein